MDLSHLQAAGMGAPGGLSASTPLTRAVAGKSNREYALSPRGKTPRTPEAMSAKQRADLETEGVLRSARTTLLNVQTDSLRTALERLVSIGTDFLNLEPTQIHQDELYSLTSELQGLSVTACSRTEWKLVKPLLSRLLFALARCARLLDFEAAEMERDEASGGEDQMASTMMNMTGQLSAIQQRPQGRKKSNLDSIPESNVEESPREEQHLDAPNLAGESPRMVQCRLCDCMIAAASMEPHLTQCQANAEAWAECNRELDVINQQMSGDGGMDGEWWWREDVVSPVSYTHLRAHETVLDLVCRLLLEKKKN
eukprot:TRINITY_DN13619_c0_g1_i2.p1 TRINITY_DN13619_c0_g1~~TRINITY_DN13619_c0_g1_i2.p1  ORF type:complete len:311 (+),score=55.48 TRINITY_DN13619_c0_g1_i2:110-1042(+)